MRKRVRKPINPNATSYVTHGETNAKRNTLSAALIQFAGARFMASALGRFVLLVKPMISGR